MGRVVHHRGFTLIEMLVALALMGLIAAILIGSLQLGGHSWQRVVRSASSTEEIAQAQEILRMRLGLLYPDDRLAGDISRPPFLLADGGSLEFSGFAPDAVTNGIWRYQISVSRSSGALEMRSAPDQQGRAASRPNNSRPEQLLAHVASVAVQFWLKPDESPGRWVDRWDSNEIPRLIHIEVDFGVNDRRRWPPLYIEPRIDTSASCAFDVVSRRCRGSA